MSRLGVVQVDLDKVVRELESQRSKAVDSGDEIVAKVTAENRDFTPEETKALAEAQKNAKDLGERISKIKTQVDARKGIDDPGESRTREDRKPGAAGREAGDAAEDESDKAERQAFRSWIRHGFDRLTPDERSIMARRSVHLGEQEQRDLSAFTGASGGFTVPQGFVAELERAMKDYSGVIAAPTRKLNTTTGNDMPWPTVTDTANTGELIGENTAVANQDPTSFGAVTLKAYLFSSKSVLVPLTLLQDSGVPIEQLLADLLAERLGRIINTFLTTGTGTNQPQGIVTASTLGRTAAAAGAITYDELVDLQHSVDQSYRRQQPAWMFNDTTLAALRKLKDSDGRPIWQPSADASMQGGPPGTLLGNPYFINQDMANIGAGNRSVVYGSFQKYIVRQVREVTLVRLTERYMERMQIGFFGFMRLDGRAINAGGNPIKHLVHP
jgi:HK97 family phage major capsid protein